MTTTQNQTETATQNIDIHFMDGKKLQYPYTCLEAVKIWHIMSFVDEETRLDSRSLALFSEGEEDEWDKGTCPGTTLFCLIKAPKRFEVGQIIDEYPTRTTIKQVLSHERSSNDKITDYAVIVDIENKENDGYDEYDKRINIEFDEDKWSYRAQFTYQNMNYNCYEDDDENEGYEYEMDTEMWADGTQQDIY